jgi:hypothetical protein
MGHQWVMVYDGCAYWEETFDTFLGVYVRWPHVPPRHPSLA